MSKQAFPQRAPAADPGAAQAEAAKAATPAASRESLPQSMSTASTSTFAHPRSGSHASWDELTSEDEDSVLLFGSLSMAARRIRFHPPEDNKESIAIAEAELLNATAAVAVAQEALREMRAPPRRTRAMKEELAAVALAREKLKDGHVLLECELRTLEVFEARRQAELRTQRKIQTQVDEIRNRVRSGVGGPRAIKAAKMAKAREEAKNSEEAETAIRKADEEAKDAEMETFRGHKEAELVLEAKREDAEIEAEIQRRREEELQQESERAREEERLRLEAEEKAKEDEERERKAMEAAAKVEALALKHAQKANAPIKAARDKVKAEQDAAEASKPRKKPGVPRLSRSSSPVDSSTSSPLNSQRGLSASGTPMASHRSGTQATPRTPGRSPPVSARSAKTGSPPVSARGTINGISAQGQSPLPSRPSKPAAVAEAVAE